MAYPFFKTVAITTTPTALGNLITAGTAPFGFRGQLTALLANSAVIVITTPTPSNNSGGSLSLPAGAAIDFDGNLQNVLVSAASTQTLLLDGKTDSGYV